MTKVNDIFDIINFVNWFFQESTACAPFTTPWKISPRVARTLLHHVVKLSRTCAASTTPWKISPRVARSFLHHVVNPSRTARPLLHHVVKLSQANDRKKHGVVHSSSVDGSQKLAVERPLPTNANLSFGKKKHTFIVVGTEARTGESWRCLAS